VKPTHLVLSSVSLFAYRPLVEKGFSVNVVGLSDILLLENHDNEKKVSLGVFLD